MILSCVLHAKNWSMMNSFAADTSWSGLVYYEKNSCRWCLVLLIFSVNRSSLLKNKTIEELSKNLFTQIAWNRFKHSLIQLVVSSSVRVMSYPLNAITNSTALTSTKQWSHFRLSECWPQNITQLVSDFATCKVPLVKVVSTISVVFTCDCNTSSSLGA